MSSKNDLLPFPPASSRSEASLPSPRSLRVRLTLYYGTLVAAALIFFAALVWGLTTSILYESATSSIQAEARVAMAEVKRELLPTSPHWPAQLSLHTLNTYQEPGIVVEVIDAQGNTRYDSDREPTTRIPLNADTVQTILSGQSSQYQSVVAGETILVEAVPINFPSTTSPAIGMLLVAKPLGEVNLALSQLQTQLLIIGAIILLCTLIGGWVIAARALQPLAEMATTARNIALTTAQGTRIGNLSQRVKRPGSHDEMVQVVDAFNEMLSNLEKAIQGQRRFVADASHELRAPLTTIQGNLAFLQQHEDDLPAAERNSMLHDAYVETLRLTQLVEELLLLAHADANVDAAFTDQEQTTATTAQPVELDRLTLQLVRQFRGRLSAEQSPLTLEIGHIEPVRASGNEEHLRQIIFILLDNALKYTPPRAETGDGRVIISVEQEDDKAVLQVRDTGIGIAPAELPHIFERFYRTDRARSRQGTGLGLAIAKTLAEQAGGYITAESVPGQGSIFSVWLPFA
ncbi:MAG TPA: HAMP domain-containing sensor histidine kinase [Ktedonosporobacter sp.]|jgi:signal transduction histidine kinase|nr:HAMP domain-containing sensor histidine kinase [Ktedonosporobacter sp.]